MENKVPKSVNRALGKGFAASPILRHKIFVEPPVARICILRFLFLQPIRSLLTRSFLTLCRGKRKRKGLGKMSYQRRLKPLAIAEHDLAEAACGDAAQSAPSGTLRLTLSLQHVINLGFA